MGLEWWARAEGGRPRMLSHHLQSGEHVVFPITESDHGGEGDGQTDHTRRLGRNFHRFVYIHCDSERMPQARGFMNHISITSKLPSTSRRKCRVLFEHPHGGTAHARCPPAFCLNPG